MPDLNKFKEEVAFDESIDWVALEALLKEDESDKGSSKTTVYDFFDKAQKSFTNIDRALKKDDLSKVGTLAKDLKESAATVGCVAVRDTAEKIEYLSDGKDEFGEAAENDEEDAIKRIRPRVKQAKEDLSTYEKHLKKFYGDEEGS